MRRGLHAPGAVRATGHVALDLLREASARRWFIVLGAGITLVLGVFAFALRLDVVDGALAASSLFGKSFLGGGVSMELDRFLGFLFQAVAYLIFYGGLVFGILACADFGPSLLAPGRIEHLLSLPLPRPALLVGTFLGVLLLAGAGAIYGAGGLALIIGLKTGSWTFDPVWAALLGAAAFVPVYAAMLTTAVFVRSPSLSAAVGGLLAVAGLVAGNRDTLLPLFEPGATRQAVEVATLVLPRVSSLGAAAGDLAGRLPVDGTALAKDLAGAWIFALALLAVGLFFFERKDF